MARVTLCSVVVVAIATLALARRAAADPEPQVGAGSAAAAVPAIAPPEPAASPKKVQDVKDVANTAKLTPIVVSPHDATRPAFQLYAEIDLPVLAVGGVFDAARLVRQQAAYCAPRCDPADLNRLDRLTAGWYSPGWGTASNIGIATLAVGAAALLVADEGALDALNDSVVVGEAALGGMAVSAIMTLSAGRPRPYLYGDAAPLTQRNSPDGGLSFLSNHTTVSFAIATSLFLTERRLHPRSNVSKWVLGVGVAAGSFIGLARVMAGDHFITDAVGGAIVGSSLGVVVASLHGSPVTVVPVISETQRGLGLATTF